MQKKVWGSLVLLLGQSLWADITLPKIFDNHMVLQRQANVPVWGLADAGEVVEVHFSSQSKKTVADSTGHWEVQLDPMDANSNPQTMSLKGKNEITLEDILVGEVWLASGQSNMEWAIRNIAPEELKAAEKLLKKTQVRVFHVTNHITSIVPLHDTIGQWKLPAELASKKDTSAVGYFFAEKLQQELGIPLGILDSNWGGQRIECFISDDGYELANLTNAKTNSEMIKNQILAMKQGLENVKKTIDQAEKGVFIPLDNNNSLNWGNATNGIYNAMIAPLAPYAIKGAIWYQGESNRGAKDYFEKLKALSAGWSKAFRVKDIPLYLVQIAPYQYEKGNNEASSLCDSIWNAQYKGAEEIHGMGIVPIQDLHIPINNIHPPYKRSVGERLAALALKRLYGKVVVDKAPKFDSAQLKENKVKVSFSDAMGELSTNDGKTPSWFELSADGQTFVTASASIKGNMVEVDVPQNLTPKFVRMGWRDIAIPNLQDAKTGWPVFAFPAQEIKN